MTENSKKLKALFSISAQPVIGVEKELIVFANPAMMSVLKRDPTGQRIDELLPAHIAKDSSEGFIGSGTLDGISASIAVTKFQEVTVYSFTLKDSSAEPTYLTPFIASLRSSAFAVRLAVDQISDRLDYSGDAKLRAYISSLYHSYFSILRLTVNLDTANRLADGTLEFTPRVCSLTDLISDLIRSLRHFLSEDDAEIVFSCREARILGSVDDSKIEQLLLNLLSNSLKHTKRGDRIVVTLRDFEDRIVISVDDTGSGVSEDVLGNIFARYSQRRLLSDMMDGIGLGLSIARGIAELHDGALIIESRGGRGTSVRVMLPKKSDLGTAIREPYAPEYDASAILRELSSILNSELYSRHYLD